MLFFLAAMKPKIVLKRIFHHNEWRYAIKFDYNKDLIEIVKSISGAQWSKSKACWHTDDDEKTLKKILVLFRDKVDIDISSLSSGDNKKNLSPLIPLQVDKDSDTILQPHHQEEYPFPEDEFSAVQKGKTRLGYSPVLFTISEPDGRLIIKFTGRYDPAWIDELNGFGRTYYDSVRQEWSIRWSQFTVDSLSDYFSSREVEVIVKKSEVPNVLQEIRQVEGGEVRDRILGKASMEGVDHVRKHLEGKRYSKRTIASYTAHLELFFKYFHDKDPDEITESDITLFIENYILKFGYSASYQNIMISAIKTFWVLYSRRIIRSDSFERPRRSRALPKVFSKEEVMRIFNATRNSKHKLILWLIYSSGLRRSEVTNIQLSDLDSDRGVLHIREGKGNIDRVVPVPQKVWEKIRAYIKDYKPVTYLFEGQTGGKYSVESVYTVFKQSLRRAGIQKDVGVHSLRHSYATHLHEGGLDIRYIQELLGHKSSRTTEIYTHVSRRNLFAIRSPIEDMDI